MLHPYQIRTNIPDALEATYAENAISVAQAVMETHKIQRHHIAEGIYIVVSEKGGTDTFTVGQPPPI